MKENISRLLNAKKIIVLILIIFCSSIIWINKKPQTKFIASDEESSFIAAYIDGEISKILPSKNDGYAVEKVVCDNDAVGKWDDDKWGLLTTNLTKRTKCNIYFKFKSSYEYEYTGNIQEFTVPKTGLYKLEVWGAQGGYAYNEKALGGNGGYSTGQIKLEKNDKLYISVGGKGTDGASYTNKTVFYGGYNGGGNARNDGATTWGAGGGATSIQNELINDGQLFNYKDKVDNVLIVAGGGGGGGWHVIAYLNNKVSPYLPHVGGSGGGYVGNNGTTESNSLAYGGSQTKGGANGTTEYSTSSSGFGTGGNYQRLTYSSGGGGGYYGGGAAYTNGSSGAGGSGYIGNSLLSYKAMYCYNCAQSNEEDTKTITTICNEERPTENCAKKGNGYARITYLGNVNVEYYIDNVKSHGVANKTIYNFDKVECSNGSNLTWDNDKWEFVINDYQENDTCKIYFSSKTTIELAYTGSEEKIVIPKTGFYKLETWGAAGGSASSNLLGGSGGYSAGVISLSKNDVLYINIGGGGNCSTGLSALGGYNGGGAAISRSSSYTMCSGGGATSITKSSGLLSSFSSTIDKILMVAGGGGGSSKYSNNSSSGGSGGGINGAVPTNACTDCGTRTGGSQTAGGIGRGSTGAFGQGGGSTSSATNGGGGGYYGGGGDSYEWGATGGSGYIGNSLLKNKSMYCYNCTESSEESTKTVTTTCNEETPTEKCAKNGNGYAKITFISEN